MTATSTERHCWRCNVARPASGHRDPSDVTISHRRHRFGRFPSHHSHAGGIRRLHLRSSVKSQRSTQIHQRHRISTHYNVGPDRPRPSHRQTPLQPVRATCCPINRQSRNQSNPQPTLLELRRCLYRHSRWRRVATSRCQHDHQADRVSSENCLSGGPAAATSTDRHGWRCLVARPTNGHSDAGDKTRRHRRQRCRRLTSNQPRCETHRQQCRPQPPPSRYRPPNLSFRDRGAQTSI